MAQASITPSDIIQYLYCPRFTYFQHVLDIPQFEEKSYKAMRGRHLHDYKKDTNKEYLRKTVGVTDKLQEQYLTNDRLRGMVDEVLTLEDGSMAPLDYKFAKYKDRIYNTYKTQLYCYAWLIEENFDVEVKRGFLVYTRSKHKLVEVTVSDKAKQHVKDTAEEIINIIQRNRFPKATKYKKRCRGCTYRNICVQ
jgi:CRISPR-associated exonuclease Cas4